VFDVDVHEVQRQLTNAVEKNESGWRWLAHWRVPQQPDAVVDNRFIREGGWLLSNSKSGESES
jgi:hypothetical protein